MNAKPFFDSVLSTVALSTFVLAVGWVDATRSPENGFDDVNRHYARVSKSYGSSGGYYDSSGGYYGSSGGYYGSSGGYVSFYGLIENRFDSDWEACSAYYAGWPEPRNDHFETAEPISGKTGEIAPTFASGELWFKWTAPEDGVVSFSTRGSVSTPMYGGETTLSVFVPVEKSSLLDSGAYGFLDSDCRDEDRIPLTAETVDYDWYLLCDAEGHWLFSDWTEDGSWLARIAYNNDEDEQIYEWTSLLSFNAEAGRDYYVYAGTFYSEVRLAWCMAGSEAEAAKPVFRFYSKKYKGHFYTADENEKDVLIATNPNWKYEGESHCANPDGGGALRPLYRFHSKSYNAHFFTIDPVERNGIILDNPNWKFEGVAYYVLSEPEVGALPVHRFWSKKYRHHFFTTDEDEKDDLIAGNPNWKYEGVAFYAWGDPPDGDPPAPPSWIDVSPGNASIEVTWEYTEGSGWWNIYREDFDTGETTFVARHYDAPFWNRHLDADPELVPGRRYRYWIEACNVSGTSSRFSSAVVSPRSAAGSSGPTGATNSGD